ncbi:hypothetical protein [Acetobacter conturbans]|uniref:Uncharacterized protein n=1 Tax=Acetobacter conturbans TaxID=1737472 RepID=A0ABX0K529_9PROT|nr:hypothetical protein [Acetobacter conturbans]NHN88539.1 hypothetical protein [Acetobacter conturbans]
MSQTTSVEQKISASAQRSLSTSIRRKAGHIFATCAMGAWIMLAAVPVLVVLIELV